MATLMDISLLEYFGSIFLFLMIFAVTYGLLTMSKMFKDVPGKNAIYAIMSLALSFFVVMFKPAAAVIKVMVPWVTILVIFVFLVLFVVKTFNQDDSLVSKLIYDKGVYWTIITIFIIIVIASFSSTFGQSLLTQQVADDGTVISSGEYVTYVNGTPGGNADLVRDFEQGPTDSANFGDNVLMTLVNPKVLGLILMMLIGLFTIMLLSGAQESW